MDLEIPTEDLYRTHILALIKMGVTKRAIAEAIDVDEGWLKHWLDGPNAKKTVRAMTLPEGDRLKTYLRTFMETLEETQRDNTSSTAGDTFRGGIASGESQSRG